jgi:hypothetical protein
MYSPLNLQFVLAEGEGFEPPKTFALTVFKTVALNRSAIPPMARKNILAGREGLEPPTVGFGDRYSTN